MSHRPFIAALTGALVMAGATFAAPAGAPSASAVQLGPMAEALQNRVGRWNVEIAFRPAADAPVARSFATRDSRIEGRWLISEFRGEIGGRPFTGFGINGYDRSRGKYTGIWVDSMSPAIMPVEGSYDRANGEFVTYSDEPTPAGARRVRSVTRTIDADTEETVLEATGPDGRAFTRMTMRLTRQK
jgi:hypothetical protein